MTKQNKEMLKDGYKFSKNLREFCEFYINTLTDYDNYHQRGSIVLSGLLTELITYGAIVLEDDKVKEFTEFLSSNILKLKKNIKN